MSLAQPHVQCVAQARGIAAFKRTHARKQLHRGLYGAARRTVTHAVVSAPADGALYDDEFLGDEKEFDARLKEHADVLRAYVEKLESGDCEVEDLGCDNVFEGAEQSAEWIRQSLVRLIETRGKLQPAQSKLLLGDVVENLCTLAENENKTAFAALQALCFRNSSACWKVGNQHNMFSTMRNMLQGGADEDVRSSALFLASTLVAFNEDLHRVVAKSRFTPVLLQLLKTRCTDMTACALALKDVRGLTECDHGLVFLRNLSQTPAQTKLLVTSGAVDVCTSFLEIQSGIGRANAAITMANLIAREDNNDVLTRDDTILEEIVELLGRAIDGEPYCNMKHTVWKYTQGIANLATMEAAKPRLAKAGVIPMLGRVLREKQHQWDRATFWAAGALWNLAFDDDVKAQILETEGIMDALEEARRLGSENTKMKARGALWMIAPPKEEENASGESTAVGLSEEEMQKLGAIENAKAQVMLSYEWHHQTQVLQIKEELNARGFNVWMDVDRMMGSTLEAMAAAIESSDAIVMCVSRRYKESQACRTEAEYAYTRKKCLIPVMVEKGYKPDGWLGILVGSKLYYNMFNTDMMQQSIPGLVTAVEAIHNDAKAPEFMQKNGSSAPAIPAESSASATSAAPRPSSSSSEGVSVPMDDEAMDRWLTAVGLQAYVHVFQHNHVHGKVLLKMHQELGQLKMGDQHELLENVFGIRSYGHRLLFLTELEELVGKLDGQLRKLKQKTVELQSRPLRGARNGSGGSRSKLE
jgi:hypothetical protein